MSKLRQSGGARFILSVLACVAIVGCNGGLIDVHSYIVDPKTSTIAVYSTDDEGNPLATVVGLREHLSEKDVHPSFATNGGIFSPELKPLGLLVADGKENIPLNLDDGDGNFFLKPNGVFYVHGDQVGIVESSEYPDLNLKPDVAIQSGPLLVDDGTIHPSFNADSANRFIRSGVGIRKDGMVIFALSQRPMSLHEFASFCRDALECPDALYLEGAISKFWWFSDAEADTQKFGSFIVVSGK